MYISVVVPVYNEEDNIRLLHEGLAPVLSGMNVPYEILFVDDGSSDGTRDELRHVAKQDAHVKVVELRRNYGQTAAMDAGLRHATGQIIVTMDGDLQNDPADIPMMVAKIEEGFDLVHGWRKNRQDTFINRKLPSMIANGLISRVTKFPVHDLGCTLKAIRKEIAQELKLYGEMHRFIPILARWHGARTAEVVTRHHARRFGKTKYGIGRTFRVILDLLTVKYLIQYMTSPMKLFGGIGLGCLVGGFLSGAATLGLKLFGGMDMTGNPLLYLSLFSTMVALQFIFLGMLGEVSARIYFESQDRRSYAVRELVNFTSTSQSKNESRTRAA